MYLNPFKEKTVSVIGITLDQGISITYIYQNILIRNSTGGNMKKTLSILALISLAVSAFAQFDIGISLAFPRELIDQCNSAAVASGQTYFNVDLTDTLNDGSSMTVFPVDNAWTHASTDGGGSWLAPIAMTNIGGTYYEDTWQSSRTNAASGAVEYYFKCETESTLTTGTPDNVPTSFPLDANKSATIGDATGDQLDVDGYSYSSLDITNFRVSYDDTYFYFRVNLGSGWKDIHVGPWYRPTTYYHILAIPFLNNESPYRDSLFFCAILTDIDVLGIIDVDDGIYKFWSEDETPINYFDNYEQIAELDCSPTNPDDDDDFTIRVPITLLTSNGWGAWPNESHAFGTGCATVGLWIINALPPYSVDNFEYVITDITKTSGVICQTNEYTIGTNSAPTLDASSIVDYNRDTTWIDLSCEYTDSDDNLPTSRQITIDDGTPATYTIGTPDHSYDDGSNFTHSEVFRCEYIDSLKYKWDFNDGAGVVSTGWKYAVVPTEIGIQVTGGAWTVGGDLGSMDTIEMTAGDVITVVNTGNCPLDFGLQADSLPNYWQLSSDHTNLDTTVIYANFTDAAAPPTFATFGTDDAIANSITWSDGTTFGGGGQSVSYCIDGANSEKLYLAFVVPQTYSAYGSQRLKLLLWASNTLP